MKILINGIPGTGKTTIGNYLASEHGFTHCNVELREDLDAFIQSDAENKVITWGFSPASDASRIHALQNLGYTMIWFDGNRDAARKAFIERGTVPVEHLDMQMDRISKMDFTEYNPILINTFDENGQFLDKEVVCKTIFDAVEKGLS